MEDQTGGMETSSEVSAIVQAGDDDDLSQASGSRNERNEELQRYMEKCPPVDFGTVSRTSVRKAYIWISDLQLGLVKQMRQRR